MVMAKEAKKNRMKRWKKRAKLKYVAQSNEEK